MNIILLGPPGAGKGTQSKLLEKSLGMVQIATGDILRASIKNGDALGQEAKSIMEAGKLVPDELIVRMIDVHMGMVDSPKGFIFDGFPRTVPQAEALDEMLKDRGEKLDAVIELKVDDVALIERVSGRFSCAKCGAGYHDKFKPTKAPGVCDSCGSTEFMRRPDDNAETMKTRLATFYEQTAPILPYYRAKGVLRTVDGMASMEQVHNAIAAIVRA